MRKALYVLIALVAFLVVAVFALPPILGPSLLKPRIADAVRDAIGRDLRIDGDFGLSLFPNVSVSLGDVKLANAPGMTDSEMVSLAALEIEIPLLPLIGKDVTVEKLVLREPVISLERNAEGAANWEFEQAAGAADQAPAEAPSGEDRGAPVSGLQLGDVRIENGAVTFRDATSGQELKVSGINVTAALSDIASALVVEGEAMLREQKLALDVTLESPEAAMTGAPIKLEAALDAALIKAGYAGSLQQQPVPGLDGQFDLDVGSVGALLAWLEQPLPEGQPDPGPLKVSATFAADGAKATLEQARIEGEALEATATGSFDGSGEVMKVALAVESGLLDIDRYLPPAAATAARPSAAEAPAGPPPSPEEMLAGLSDEPIDLSMLRQTEADVKVALGGIKAQGYEVGPIGLDVTLQDGVLAAELSELGLYGGNVTATLGLDGAGEALSLDAKVDIDSAGIGELAKAAAPDAPPPIGGVLSGALELTAQGTSPRGLAESAQGRLALDLGGVQVQDERAAALSELKLAFELPGIESAPSLDASLVYNQQRVELALSVAPIKEVLAGGPFPLELSVDSSLVTAGYSGSVQHQPVQGLDGQFDLEIGSVGRLLSWLGQPLPEGQPDPGPLKVAATFTADGQKVALEQAKITGEGLEATAKGSFDGSGEVKRVALELESGLLDIDRYLPPPKPMAQAAPEAPAGPPPSPDQLLAGLPDEPLDLSGLKQTEADVKVALGGVKAQGYEVGPIALAVTLQGGVLAAELSELGLYGGSVSGQLGLDGAVDALGVDATVTIANAGIGELAAVASPDGPPPVSGVLSGVVELATQGASVKQLAEGAKGRVSLDLGGVEVQDPRAGALSELKLALDLPGLEAAPSLDASLVYNGEPVELALSLAPVGDLLGGGAVPLDLKATSPKITLAYAGTVQQQPVPGLDGKLDLDVPSVGALLVWLDQPLPEGQPDPGSLKVAASFAADGAKAALEEATIEGKAVKVRAVGSFDAGGEIASFNADVTVDELDLNAYLPPPKEGEAAPESEPAPSEPAAQGWSEEPIDVAGLRLANGEIKIKTGPVKYRGLTIERSGAVLTLRDGVMQLGLNELVLAEGQVTAAAMLDGSGEALALEYNAKVDQVQSKPFLQTFSGIDWLSGLGNFEAQGTARGRSQKELVSSLNGGGSFAFLDGAIEGVNLAETLRNVGTLGMGAEGGKIPKTDFTELSGSFVITDGVIDNQDMKMLAPLIRLSGAGEVPMPPQTVDYGVEAKLVASLEGQGGDEALAGLPIPIRVTGPWSKPSYEIDWQAAFQSAATDPERLANMPAELTAKAKDFGVDLPIPGGEGVGELLETVPGLPGGEGEAAADPAGAAAGAAGAVGAGLKGLLGSDKGDSEEAAGSPSDEAAPAQAQPAPEAAVEDAGEKVLEDAGKTLKGLFGD